MDPSLSYPKENGEKMKKVLIGALMGTMCTLFIPPLLLLLVGIVKAYDFLEKSLGPLSEVWAISAIYFTFIGGFIGFLKMIGEKQ